MSDLSPNDARLLDLLVENSLITPGQRERLAAAVGKGMPLAEAIHKVPMVDPVKLGSMQSLAAQAEPDAPGDIADEETVRNVPAPAAQVVPELDIDLEIEFEEPGAASALPIAIIRAGSEDDTLDGESNESGAYNADTMSAIEFPDLDGDDDLDIPDDFEIPAEAQVPAGPKPAPVPADLDFDDLDDLDMDFDVPAPKPAAGFRPSDALSALDEALGDTDDVDSHRPGPMDTVDRELGSRFEDVFASDDELDGGPGSNDSVERVPLSALANFETLPDMAHLDQYEQAGMQAQTFDLSVDDGIDLIKQVNAYLVEALDTESTGMVLDTRTKKDNLLFYDESRTVADRETVAGDASRVAGRLKAMARIEAWRGKTSGKGNCNIVLDGLPRKAYVEAEAVDGGEVVVVHFW